MVAVDLNKLKPRDRVRLKLPPEDVLPPLPPKTAEEEALDKELAAKKKGKK